MLKGKVETVGGASFSRRAKRCVVLNPKAGAVKDLPVLLDAFAKLGPFEVSLTTRPGEAEKHARAAVRAGFKEIVAAGGDGTLNEVINGVAPDFDRVRVGLIPLGTGNDFARCLGLPAKLEDCIDVLLAGKTVDVDVVRVRSDRVRHFINVSTGGFSGVVDEKLTPEIKRTWGSLAYLRGAAAALPELRGYNTTVRFDDGEELSLCLYNVVIANGRYVAGGLPIAPDAHFADGMLDVILIPERVTTEMVVLAAQIVLGKHLSSDMIVTRRARKVTVKSRPGMWFNLDGELVGNAPATFQVKPKALKFVAGTA